MELVDIYNKKGENLNYKKERYEKLKDTEYAKVVHIWIKNSKGLYLVQQRAKTKKVDPLNWSMTSGTNDPGENILDTAIREIKEEINIDVKKEELEELVTLIPIDNDNPYDNHIATIYLVEKNIDLKDIRYQESEVCKCEYWSKQEILNAVKEEKFTNFATWYKDYFNYIFK